MDPLFDVSEKSIIVAGAGGGIGSVVATKYAERNALLTLCDINRQKLDAVTELVNRKSIRVTADIRSETECRAVMQAAIRDYQRVDVVVNAVGVLPIASANDMNTDVFRESLESNVTGAFILSKVAKEFMNTGGVIIHIASVSSFVANIGYSAYSASKAALSQLVKVLAREWAEEGVRVNAIGPALIETPLTRDFLADDKFLNNAIASIPLGRLAKPDDLFGTILLLSSSAGSFITGQTIYVDGGRTLV